MNNLSFVQEYYLCAINGKGDMPAFTSNEVSACFVVGGIMELINQGFIEPDEKNRLTATKPLDAPISYLQPLYDNIISFKKPKDVMGVAKTYFNGMGFGKVVSDLLTPLGLSLLAADCVDELPEQGLLIKKTKYAPKPEAVTRVIEKIRAEAPRLNLLSRYTV